MSHKVHCGIKLSNQWWIKDFRGQWKNALRGPYWQTSLETHVFVRTYLSTANCCLYVQIQQQINR